MISNAEQTRDVLAEMLTENTGTNMLDSGGAYGRHWEANQKAAGDNPRAYFDARPESTLEITASDRQSGWKLIARIDITHDIYHWLAEVVEYDAEMDKRFQEFAELEANKDRGWLDLMSEFPYLACDSPKGFYGDNEPFGPELSYNNEDLLSQAIQYIYWADPDTDIEYVLLQIHGGCDMRDGYTRPRAFRTSIEGDPVSILDYSRWGIVCSECRAVWDSFGEASWTDSDYEDHIVPDLAELRCIEGDAEMAERVCTEKTGDDGKSMLVTEQDSADTFCPVCGRGKLSSYFY